MAPPALTTLAAAAMLGAALAASAAIPTTTAAAAAAAGRAPASLFLVGTGVHAGNTPSIAAPWAGLGATAAAAPAAVAAAAAARALVAAPLPLRSAVGLPPRPIAAARRRRRGGVGRLPSTARQASLPPQVLPGARSMYVNCGGPFTTFDGATWVADTDGGVPANSPVFGVPSATNLPVLLRTNRFSLKTMTYTRRVPAASTYRVTLHWAEIFVAGPGIRNMDVFVAVDGAQPKELAIGLDVYERAGNATPYSLSYPPEGTDAMYIEDRVAIYLQPTFFDEAGENPFLSAFRVVEETPAPTPTPPAAAEGDPAEIGELLREATTIADVAIPARVAAASYLRDKADAVATADAAAAAAARLFGGATGGGTAAAAAVTDAYAAVVNARAEVTSAAAGLTGDDFRTADASVTAELAAVRGAAAALSPTVCAYLTGETGGVSGAQVAALEERVVYVELAVERLLRYLADDRAAAAAVWAATDRLGERVDELRTLVGEAPEA